MKLRILFMSVALVMSTIMFSQVIQNCRETKVKYEKSLKYATLTPVTIPQMSEILKKDDNIKIVIEYSSCDPKIFNYIEKVVLPYWNAQDKSQVSLYLIAKDCGYLQNIEQFFVKNHLDIKRYYYRDNSSKFCVHSKNVNINRSKDIQRSHFTNANDFEDFSSSDIRWFIANKDNSVKLVEYIASDFKGKSQHQIMPIMIESLPKDITTLDFVSIDTLSMPEESMVVDLIKIIWSYKK